MPPVREYTIKIKEDLSAMKKTVSERQPRYRELSSERIGRLLEQALKALSKNQKEFKASIDRLTKELSIERRPTSGKREFNQSVELLGKQIKSLSKSLKELPLTKKVALIDLETSPIRKGGKLGGKVDFITQAGVLVASLKDMLTKTAKELEKQTKSIYIKPPKKLASTKAEYRKIMKPLTEKGINIVPWEQLEKSGLEVKKALDKIAKTIQGAELIIGHNIEQFDIKVLNDAFKDAGTKIDLAAQEYYDTVIASRKKFPKRTGHELTGYEKDMVLAGKEYAGAAHDAAHDVLVTADVLKALAGKSKELEAAEGDLTNILLKLSNRVEAIFAGASKLESSFEYVNKEVLSTGKSFKSLHDTVPIADESLTNLIEETDKTAKALNNYSKKAFIDIKKVSEIKSGIETTTFKPSIVHPTTTPYRYKGVPPGADVPYGTGLIDKRISALAASLKKLQDDMVKALQQGLRKGVEILKTEEEEFFQLGRGGREWELQIIDVNDLRRTLRESFGKRVPLEVDTRELVKTYKKFYAERESGYPRSVEETAAEIYSWFRKYGKEEVGAKAVKEIDPYVKKMYEEFKTKGAEIVAQLESDPNLERLYEATALQSKATEHLTKRFLKVLTLPAARIAKEGTVGFETKYGAERALAQFATLETGLEVLAKEFKDLGGVTKEHVTYLHRIAKLPLRPEKKVELEESEKLASSLIESVKRLGGRELITEGYRESIKLRKIERKEDIKGFDELRMTFSKLEEEAKRLNVTSLDVASALNKVDFENFYDVLNRLYTGGKEPFLTTKAGRITDWTRNLRQISDMQNELRGLMPLKGPGMVKRGAYEEQVVKVLSKQGLGEMIPTQQKERIREVNLLWAEMVRSAEKLGKKMPEVTSIDLSDAAASQFTEFNANSASTLRALSKVMTSASMAGVRGQVPFEEFTSINRAMSQTANVLKTLTAEAPTIVSSREMEMIKSGKWGAGKYGINVLTELRNTASTFEDQIVISGKLAKAFTEIVKPLVKAAAKFGEIGEIEPGYKRIGGKAKQYFQATLEEAEYNKLIEGVSSRIQEVLGVPTRYRGRADIAKIGEEIQNVMREHRGESIEVQTAKLTETFLNYFGRKLVTRFGTKGVAITPTTPPTEIKEYKDIARAMAAGLKAEVVPGAGLGFAKIPKSMGQLLVEMFSESGIDKLFSRDVLDSLTKRLEESGNKFILDLFTDARKGLVTGKEAKKQQDLFEETSSAFKKAFGEELPKDSMEAVKFIRNKYKKVISEGEIFELKPIEARISARGIAKRGLMPEVLEVLVNNLVGSTEGVTEILSQASEKTLTASDEMREAINKYLAVLGYEPLKNLEAMQERLKMEGVAPEQIKTLKEWEKQWHVYTEGLNEFGEKVQDIFVGPKYLGITEEPHIYKGWTEREIAKGIKGERLNFQAFAAYAGIFGAGSSMLKELADATGLTAEEGWELIRALQMIDPALKNFKESMLGTLKEVKLTDIKSFEAGTATLGELKDTMFDIAKYPSPFKVKMPTAGKGAEKFYEEMYVPGPALRATYPEELMGGKVAPTNMSRYLSNLINAAQAVEDISRAATRGEMTLDDRTMDKFARTVREELTQKLTETYKEVASIESKQHITPANIELMESIINKLKPILEKQRVPAPYARPAIKQGIEFPTMLEAIESYEKELAGAPKKYSRVLSRIMDMVIGPQPEALREEEEKIERALKQYRERRAAKEKLGTPLGEEDVPLEYMKAYKIYGRGGKVPFEDVMGSFRKQLEARKEAPTVFEVEIQAGNLKEFADKVGINLEITVKEALERAMESLSRAKIAYFEQLAKTVLGPKHAIEQTFFQRTIPAITGKAVSAITDKTEELGDLLSLFEGKKFDIKLDMPNIDELRNALKGIIEDHEKYITKSKQLGLPVLKEREIGLSPLMAKALKVETAEGAKTNLAKLIEKREKMTEKELEELKLSRDVFVESVRYPFYGTVSVQPHKAKLMKGPESKYAVTVPGAPELDLPKLRGIIDKLEEYVYGKFKGEKLADPGLLQKRESAWAEGTEKGAEKAVKLTKEIESLIAIINKATPTFINMEQKLDYDGDALFVHTGQLEESRKEIAKHFNALGEDITSVRSLFSTFFTAIKETDVRSLTEMANIFAKKHPAEKGYAWLTKPYIQKEVKNLGIDEIMEALFSYTKEATKLKGEIKKLETTGASVEEVSKIRSEKIGEWTGGFMEKEVLPTVYKKLGGAVAEEARMGPGVFEERVRALSEELVRRRLWEQKYSDAIVGQLYKLHTGQTVEAISRLARMSELQTGFGSGLAKTGQKVFEPSKEFLGTWPKKSAALGGRPVQEFATRMNEIMRFVIQKGMDEKHAGVEAVGTEILKNVAKKGGARTIMRIMREEEDQFSDLWDFNEQITKEAQLRLGALPTTELKGELKRFQVGRMTYEDLKKEFESLGGEVSGDAPREVLVDALVEAAKKADISKDRSHIVNEIIKYIDLEAVFEELFEMIKRTAVKGLIKELQIEVAELPPERRVRREAEIARAGGYESFAKRGIESAAVSDVGISILRYVTSNLQPLYRMRTRMETPAMAAGRTRERIEAPSMVLPLVGGEKLRETYEDVMKTARVLSRSMAGTIGTAGGGVHSLMVLSALEKRYRDLEKITEVAKRAEIPEGYGKELATKEFPYLLGSAVEEIPKLASDVWGESWEESGDVIINSIDTWANKLKKVKDTASGKIEELSQIMSIPPLATEEEYKAYTEFLSRHEDVVKKISNKIETMVRQTAKVPEEKMDEVVDSFTDQAQAFLRFQVGMSEQLKRVSEAMRATPFQKLSLEMAFPKYEAAIGKGPVDLANEINRREKESFEDLKQRKLKEHKDYQERIEEFWQKQSMARSSGIKETVETYKKPEIAAEDIKRVITEALDEVSKVAQDSFEDEIIRKKILALRALEEKAAGGPKAKEEVPLYKLYRGSGLYGGGGYGGVPQEEAILKQMLGKEEKSMLLETTGFRGSAIHRAKQKEFIKKYSEYGDVQIEGLVEDLDNMITGHYDVLFKAATGEKRVVDIKAIYDPKKFAAIERIAKEMQEKKITLGEYLERIGVQDAELARRLESYLSQVNFYLSANIDALGGLLAISMEDPTKEVKLELGKFDPARFKRDAEVVKRARAKVEEMISSITDKVKKREFVEALPKTLGLETLRQIAKSPEQLARGEEELFDKWSKEYLAAYKAMSEGRREKMWAATGAGTVGAGGAGIGGVGGGMPPTGGDGEDEFERLRKKVEALLGRSTRLSIEEAMKLADAVYEANRAYMDSLIDGNEKLANKYIKLKELMDAAFEATYGERGIKEVEKIRGVFKMAEAGGPVKGVGGIPPGIEIPKEEPFATTAYLKAMLRKATQFHDLFGGKDIERFGEEIESLLSETLKEGPTFDVASKISDAIKKLAPEKRGYIAKIWRYYKKSVSEYFIKQLDELEQSIKSAKTDEAERKAYDQYERTLQAFIGNIKRTLGKMSDIYTRGGFGEMKEWVSPELAKGAGLYRRPEELAEIARQTSAMSGEFRPIFDVLIGDLDPMLLENMLTPLEKIRIAFTMLAKEDKGLKAILEDADLFRRIGDQAVKAWNFDRMIRGVTQLRAGLQEWNRMQISGFGAVGGAEDYTEAQRKNIQDTIKYLRQLEGMIGPVGGPAGSRWGMTQVPGFLDPKEQELLHKRNIALVREQFKLSEKAGGPVKGQRFTYRQRIVDPASKQVLKDTAEEFKKLGDAATYGGDRVGIFTQRTEDMIGAFQARKGVGQVFRRVIFWGGASTIVWGLVQALKNVVSTISDVEFGIARLRQVMSPLETDFEHITKAALEFAKQFGQPIRSVIDSMRVFAQQGLAQEEVIERARTSQLAANVSTLSASDATEALTAAMKVYGKEGASTLRFLDSWSQVEARHAITSADLANSMKKAAAVAKTSGITFDELNAIVTGIGETSRQTGKEIGTALRFMFRRIQASKGPKALGEIGVPVIGEEGDLRKGFDILGDLAGKWDELTNSQKLSIAQAIGGRRHYNSLIILMDHWGDALDTLEDSINSKGAAERRNAIVMETYAKRLQQVKSAAVELQVQFGKLALPIAKVLLTGFKGLLETISNIPNSVKTVALAVAGLFALFSKGQGFITRFSDSFRLLPEIMRDLASAVSKELKIGLFEVFGKLPGKLEIDTRGLKTIMEATNMGDLESILGKVGYKAAEFGRSWNSMLSEISVGGATALEVVSKLFGRFGTLLELGGTALAATGSPITQAFGGVLRIAEKGAEGAEAVSIRVAKAMGISAEKLAEWTKGNTSFVKSVTPMIASLAALTPVAIKTWGSMKRLASSADEYEKAMAGARRKTSGELQALKDLSSGYRKLESTIEDLNKARKPEAKQKALAREEYESPVFGMAELYKNTQKFGNELAKSNFTLIESFDEFGNVVLKTNRSLKDHIDLLTSAKREEVGKKESDILSKYVEDLTGGKGFTETFKYELKRFVKEIPAIGGLIAKHIAISPSKELDVLRDKMNKILSLREKYPMSTAVEPLFQKYYKQLEDARSKFGSTYKSFRRVLADVSTKGLEPLEIRDLLDTEELRKGFELMVRIEPKLQIKEVRGKVDWKDILGTEILKRIYPEKPLDFAAPLTKELLLQSKMLKRTGKAFAGDIVLFTEDINNTIELFGRGVGKGFDVAGRQGILKFKEGVGYFVEYVTKEMRKVKEVPFSDVEKFVDAIFPTVTIQERLQDNLAVLEEIVAGAAAGMTGITAQEFKRSFSLGERFFPQIPTTTLLQTTKGWAPGAGYGEMPYKGAEIPRTYETPFADLTKRWDEWMQTFWFEPIEQLKMIAEPAEKRAMAGGGPGYGMAEDIQRLLDVLKNNQIVIQYRALHEDLIKTLNEGSRTLKENIAAEKIRNEYLVQTGGILKGMPEDLSDINLGVKKFSELTAQQRVLLGERARPSEERRFTTARGAYREARIRRESLVGQVESIERARVQLREIRSTAVGLGAALSPEEAQRMVESVAIAGNKPLGLILDQEKQVVSNTGRMAETMDDLLAQMGDPEAIIRRSFRQFEHIEKQTKIVKADITRGSIKGIGERFNYLVKLRGIYEEVGRKDLIKAIDASLGDLSNTLVEKIGMKKALKVFEEQQLVDRLYGVNATRDVINAVAGQAPTPLKGTEKLLMRLPGELSKKEFIQKAIGDLGLREFTQVLEKYVGKTDKSSEYLKTSAEMIRKFGRVMPTIGSLAKYVPIPPTERERVLGSKEFKGLEKEMSSQTVVSVTTSKNIQKMFAAYSGFQDIFRRAANREARYFEIQISELRGQRKNTTDQLKAGTISKEEAKKSTIDIDKKIVEMSAKREEAIGTAERRATQEAIGLITTGGISFARAVGLSEGALKGLGETAAGALVAWHAWSALTGEPIPEYIKDLGDKAKEAAKKVGKEFPGWAARTWLKVEKMFGFGLGGAIKTAEEEARKKKPIFTEEEREKIKKAKDLQVNEKQLKKADELLKGIKKDDAKQLTTDKQILSENKQQTDILLGIHEAVKMFNDLRRERAKETEEQTKATKGIEGEQKGQKAETKKQTDYSKKESDNIKAQVSYSKQLRDKVDAIKAERLREGDIGTKIRDILTVALLTATTGYVADTQAFGAELGEHESKAKKMSELTVKLIEKFPSEVGKAIEVLKEERAEREKKLAKPGITKTEERSIVADQEAAYEEVGNMLLELSTKLKDQASDAGQIMSEAADKMRLREIAEEIKMGMEELDNSIRVSKIVSIFENKFISPLVGALKGIHVPQIDFGRKITDLSPYESLLIGSKKFRKVGEGVEKDMTERAALVSRATSMMEEIETSRYKELTDIEKEYFDLLGDQLDKIKVRINDLNGSIAEGTRKISEATVAEEFRLEKLAEAAMVLKETALAEARAKIPTGVGIQTGISPFAGGIDFGARTMRELAPMQRAFMENESAFKDYNKRVAEAGSATSRYENLISRRADVEHRAGREREGAALGFLGFGVSKETKKELELINKELEGGFLIGGGAESAAIKTAEALSRLTNSLYALSEASIFQNKIETARINVLQEHARLITRTQLGKPIVGAGIRGGFPEIETGRAPYQLAPTERLLTEAGAESKKIIMLYQLLQSQRQNEISLLQDGRAALIRYNEQLEAAKEKGQDTKGIEDAMDRQIDKNRALEQNIGGLINKLGDLKSVVEAVSFQGLMSDLENLKRSFLVREAAKYDETMWDMMRGGKHPLAPVVPTFEMIQAGIPEEKLWDMTKYEAREASLRASGKPVKEMDLAGIRFEKWRDTMLYEQQKENEDLIEQRRHGEEILNRLGAARFKAEALGQTNLINGIDVLRDKMKEMVRTAPKVEKREGDLLYYKSVDFSGFFKLMKELTPELDAKNFTDPIISELKEHTNLLNIIAGVKVGKEARPKTITGAGFFERIPMYYEKQRKGITGKIYGGGETAVDVVKEFLYGDFFRGWKSIFSGIKEKFSEEFSIINFLLYGEKRAIGGQIFGLGGPREDKVPIWASPYEYIVKASSAKKLGYNNLDYMNETGQIPGFVAGGLIQKFKNGEKVEKDPDDMTGPEKIEWLKKKYPNVGELESKEIVKKGWFTSIFEKMKGVIDWDTEKPQAAPVAPDKTKKEFTIPPNIKDENLKVLLETMDAKKIKKYKGGLIQAFQESVGGKIPQYLLGTDYVPRDELAYVHKGEQIIPAGERSTLKAVSDSGEKIGQEIKRAIEDALKDIKVEVEDKKIELDSEDFDRSIDRLSVIFDKTINVSAPTAVGADNSLARLDEFIETADKKFSVIELALYDNIGEVNEIKEITIPTLSNEMYTQTARMVDSTKDDSYLREKLHELFNDLENFKLTPMDTRIRTVENLINSMDQGIKDNFDRIASLNIRSGLTII